MPRNSKGVCVFDIETWVELVRDVYAMEDGAYF
jgi:hypothetical protein